jgi:hypothetical protein
MKTYDSYLKLQEIPSHYRKTILYDSLALSGNDIKTLYNAPTAILEGAYFDANKLTNLKGDLKIVGWSFTANSNYLVSLIGDIRAIGDSFGLWHNTFFSMDFIPSYVGNWIFYR